VIDPFQTNQESGRASKFITIFVPTSQIEEEETYRQIMCDFTVVGQQLKSLPCHIKFTLYPDKRFMMGWINVGPLGARFKQGLKKIVRSRTPEERKYIYTQECRMRLDGKDVKIYLRNRSFDDKTYTIWEFDAYFRKFGVRETVGFSNY